MLATWTLNAAMLFVTTTGTLLVFLFVYNTLPRASSCPACGVTAGKDQRHVLIALGLLALWLVMEDAAFILS